MQLPHQRCPCRPPADDSYDGGGGALGTAPTYTMQGRRRINQSGLEGEVGRICRFLGPGTSNASERGHVWWKPMSVMLAIT